MKRLAVSLIALLAAAPAPAQDIELAEIVVSALRTAAERLRTGVSVDVVDAEDLKKSRDTSVASALSRLPGVSTTQSGPFGSTSNLRVRGADGRYLAVFIDGIKVSDPTGTEVKFDWGSLMTSDVARIEVLRGSQSALWGGSAVGGVINISTLGAMEEGTHQTAAVEVGSFNTAKLSYGLTQKTDRLELAFTGTHLRTDGFSAADGGTEDDSAEASRLSFTARYKVSDTLALGGAVFAQDTAQDYDGYGPVCPAGLPVWVTACLGDLIDYSQTRREKGARAFAELSLGNTDHVFDVSLFDVERGYDEAGDTSSFGGRRVSLSWQGTTEVSQALSFVYGADWSEETADYTNLPDGSASTAVSGAFAQAIWAPSDVLDVSAALRADHNSGFGTFTTGRLAVAYRPVEGTTLRAAYATGFRAPSIDERFGDYGGDYPFVGNPDLTPEESESVEVGIEQTVGAARLSATLFKLEVDNLITYKFLIPTSTLENLPGVSTRQGVELAAVLPISDALELGLAYSYTDARKPDGNRLIQVPYHNLALSIDASLSDRLSTGLTLTHVAGRIDNDPNLFAVEAMPDYTVLNGQVTYDLTGSTEAYVRVENILDADYQLVDGFAASDRAVYAGLQTRF